MDKEFEDALSKIKEHKLLFAAGVVVLIIIGFIAYVFIGGMFTSGVTRYDYPAEYGPAYAPLGGISKSAYEEQVEQSAVETLSQPSEYQIKRGSANIKSVNAESDYEKLKQKTESFEGWVETVGKNENYRQITITTNLKIPFENFDSYADWLMKNFDVENANLELYKISVERQQDEIQILQTALGVYDDFLERVEEMDVSEDSIRLALRITERKLDVMRMLRQYGYSVEQVEKQAEHANLRITLTQEKEIELMPEDLGQELRTKLRNSIREITNAGMDLITAPIAIFVKIIVWIIYAIIVLIPVYFAIRILLKVFRYMGKKV